MHPARPQRSALLAVSLFVTLLFAGCASPTEGRAENLALFDVADDPYLGDPDASLVVVSFESPLCSGCKHFHLNILPGLKSEFFTPDGPAVYYFKQFDTYGRTGHGADERALQIAMECTARTSNEAFWSLTQALFMGQFRYDRENVQVLLEQVADEHGIDPEPILSCYGKRESEDDVRADLEVASGLDIVGTPSHFVFGREGAAVETHDVGATLRARLADGSTDRSA